ncbi:hypothetical protein V6N11_057693 [Hibiscus sabdariffa]|uniref:Uncharacterized protein n=1 Tax=Hibiscus sabdariffa TaxID=183260 RepID=A0ABR2NIH1_9ROSI
MHPACESAFLHPSPVMMKKSNAVCSGSVLKTRKKPRFVVHAAGDGGQSQVTSTRRHVSINTELELENLA